MRDYLARRSPRYIYIAIMTAYPRAFGHYHVFVIVDDAASKQETYNSLANDVDACIHAILIIKLVSITSCC